jgi:hypothetical protein
MKCEECGGEYNEELDDCCPVCRAGSGANNQQMADECISPDEEDTRVKYTREELEAFMEEEDNFPW